MNFNKIVSLYNQEKERVKSQIFTPIIEVINDKKYEEFFNYFLITNINVEIKRNYKNITPVSFVKNCYETIDAILENSTYTEIYNKVINKILNTCNFDILKIVFGIKDYQPWALSLFKYLAYKYFEEKKLENIKERILDGSFDPVEYINDTRLNILKDAVFKTLYGYSFTSISTFEYWQRTVGLSHQKYLAFSKIVNGNNPAIHLVNSFLYFYSNEKTKKYSNKIPHEYKSFKPFDTPKIDSKEFAEKWIVEYLATLSLNSKFQIILWKAIQNLTFGTNVNGKTIAMRTISQININIKDVYKLDEESQNFITSLKIQSLMNKDVPATFDLFLNQNKQTLISKMKKIDTVYKTLMKRYSNQ